MKFSQDYTLNIIKHANLFPHCKFESGYKHALINIHCCLRLSIQNNHSELINNLSGIFNNKFPIIIDMDQLKNNYFSIKKKLDNSIHEKKSIDIIFITECKKIIFIDYKLNKFSTKKIFQTLKDKIDDSSEILAPLTNNNEYTINDITYVIYKDDDIQEVRDIYCRKLDEIDDNQDDSIYKKCYPLSIEDLYNNFFRES